MKGFIMLIQSIKDMMRYKDLVSYLVKGEFKAKYSGTILGYIWWILDPLFFMMIYVLLIGVILGRGGPDYPAFLICGLVAWKFTAGCLSDCVNSISGNLRMMNQVFLPVIIFPTIKCINNLINLGFGLLLVLVIISFYPIQFSVNILYLPLIVLVQLLFNLSLGLILAHFGVFFKDIQTIMQSFVLRVWFYLSPIIYAPDLIPDKYLHLFMLNPVAPLLTSYRNVLMYGKSPDFTGLLILFLFSVLLYTLGTSLVYKNYGNYARVV